MVIGYEIYIFSQLPPYVIILSLSGVKTRARHFLFICIVPISSFVILDNKNISPNLPHIAISLPLGDTSKF
jgi:hypothetical protein